MVFSGSQNSYYQRTPCTYQLFIYIGNILFSADCTKGLICIAKKCGSMGGTGEYCGDYKDCRLLSYYQFSISFKFQTLIFFFFCRGDGYCDIKKNKCRKKKNPGIKCQLDKQCHNSICLESQKEPLSQKGNNRGFGWVLVQLFFFKCFSFSQIFPFFFRQRRPTFETKYCALIGAKPKGPCDPRSYHCSIGYVCQEKKLEGNRELGGFLKYSLIEVQ